MPLDVKKLMNTLLSHQRAVAAQPKIISIVKTLADRPIVHLKPCPSAENRPMPPQVNAASNM
ncbi:hypothetical protein FJV76_13140 [Mesorhizobium sp. WSM4303]|uniref:hypothetical protein n=1 Tax=unclassified Mesorhizobium TaxID=325217 RepID=UPI00115EB2C7|nr:MULTISPECIES: hypothetical protein [unclassified Mesorhizobium]TRC98268.1 hypothetical protein FJV77_07250 [Mesorhizobium sp. WSM4306]TRD04245.1 hypothetical protein FJV76_13140 [Mesorhizobium sp. WSM4303]